MPKTFQNEVYEEMKHIFQGSDRPATMKDLNEMKYLERVIKECLRIYPSVPFISRETTEDIQLGKREKARLLND
jgi:cytochrome P450 family 4